MKIHGLSLRALIEVLLNINCIVNSVADPDPGFLVGSGSGFLDPDPDPPISVILPIFSP